MRNVCRYYDTTHSWKITGVSNLRIVSRLGQLSSAPDKQNWFIFFSLIAVKLQNISDRQRPAPKMEICLQKENGCCAGLWNDFYYAVAAGL